MKSVFGRTLALIAFTLAGAGAATAADASKTASVPDIDIQQGYALKGYDPVAYFDEGHPAAGNKGFSYQWRGATWLFASAKHRDQFMADPTHYAPQFGGYCALGVSENATPDGDPLQWAIVDGKLYVNYNAEAMGIWNKDRAGRIQKAQKNWPSIPKHALEASSASAAPASTSK
jgi:YHS domain-containing protein